MITSQDQFRINLNQNLWGLVVGLLALGVSEYYKLSTLHCFSVAITSVMTVSIFVTTYAYTVNCWKSKYTKSGTE